MKKNRRAHAIFQMVYPLLPILFMAIYLLTFASDAKAVNVNPNSDIAKEKYATFDFNIPADIILGGDSTKIIFAGVPTKIKAQKPGVAPLIKINPDTYISIDEFRNIKYSVIREISFIGACKDHPEGLIEIYPKKENVSVNKEVKETDALSHLEKPGHKDTEGYKIFVNGIEVQEEILNYIQPGLITGLTVDKQKKSFNFTLKETKE